MDQATTMELIPQMEHNKTARSPRYFRMNARHHAGVNPPCASCIPSLGILRSTQELALVEILVLSESAIHLMVIKARHITILNHCRMPVAFSGIPSRNKEEALLSYELKLTLAIICRMI